MNEKPKPLPFKVKNWALRVGILIFAFVGVISAMKNMETWKESKKPQRQLQIRSTFTK